MAEEEVYVLRERYDRWTGKAWLELLPSGRRHPIGPGYSALRRELRARWPDRPFDSDWADGRFAPSPFGRPLGPVLTLGAGALLGGVAAGAAAFGPLGAVAIGCAGIWPLVRWLDGVIVSRRGIGVGPPWALVIPWHEVQRIGVFQRGRATELWVVGRRGASTGTVPPPLLPAVRARIWRLGGIRLEAGDGGLDVRYARWRAAAAGVPWGAGLGTALGAACSEAPWEVLGIGGLCTLGLVLLGASVEARATGWGTGAVGWLTLLYALILAIVGAAGWL